MMITRYVLWTLLLLALVLEGVAVFHPDVALITDVMREAHPMVILGIGILIGHFFWYKRH